MRECFSSAKGLIYSQNVTLNSVNNIESSYKHWMFRGKGNNLYLDHNYAIANWSV